ncbi:MaoC family dehydratase N-terminal domain-containing protein [Caldinitratiruptor microaerophilus]|uniref:UPF0336 protein n=1 Tax=Caldinitratiruptor microaerophilus TaxID=671077 RepID=A0AA35CIL1_9FIRM|nr:MaoC family dehydratase N-terminal domain-containing protein [Caldinitratiruptor microaerophilus]BDG58988.1 UPF0336 protein [Caldinitratiruptor microaerophilus]
MSVDRSMVGRELEPVLVEVERGAIRRFAEALGDPNPVYREGRVAPPTFPTTFRFPLTELGIEPSRVLHGEQEFEYTRPLRAGDRLVCRTRVADVYERTGRLGRMTFVVVTTEGRDEKGAPVFTARSTLIVR